MLQAETFSVADPMWVRTTLAERLRAEIESHAAGEGLPRILRAEVLVEGLDALAWLSAQPAGARGYWSDREQDFQLAGTGRADMMASQSCVDLEEGLGELRERLRSARGEPRYFGGMRFYEPARRDEEWAPFMGFRFILPRFEVVHRDGVTTLACNMRTDENAESVFSDIASLPLGPEGHRALPGWTRRIDQPDRDGWLRSARAITGDIANGLIDKVVLARRVTLEFAEPIDAARVLRHLKEATQSSFHFCFQPDANHAFLGASPERLYRRDGTRLRTEALAGTRPRGATPEEDAALAADLANSGKERHEHAMVVEGIAEMLRGLTQDLVHDPESKVLILRRAQHLITRFRGVLAPEVSDAELLAALHPTPAVGGTPRTAAVERIHREEPFDRGFYAAPMGWIERDAAQFAVAIRSALVAGRSIHLFSGAGIVAGSDAESEWEEVEQKIQDFLAVLPRA